VTGDVQSGLTKESKVIRLGLTMSEPRFATPKEALLHAAKTLGGQAAIATLLRYPDRRNVSPWFSTDRPFPAEHCPALERATRAVAALRSDSSLIVLCEELRPDVEWGVLRMQAA
jgi:DNA-binding transcriptional regulator YdaS (Cro superfamily)